MNTQLRNRIFLAAGATLAAVALVVGASATTAVMVEANRPVAPKAAPFLYPAFPQTLAHESAEAFAGWAFGSTEPAARRAAAALVYTQRGIRPQVVQALEDWPSWSEDSVLANPIGIAQTRALVIFAAACRVTGGQLAVDPVFSDGITESGCAAVVHASQKEASPYRQLAVDPGTDAVAIFERFANPIARKILLGLNGQLPNSR